MTLTVCIQGLDGMVLASDSRATYGDPRGITAQNDTVKKVYILSKHVGMTIAGANEIGEKLKDEISKEVTEKNIDGATNVLEVVRRIVKERYDDWFKGFLIQPLQIGISEKPQRPNLIILIGGYDINEKGEIGVQRIYSLNSPTNFAPHLHNTKFALSGVPQYATYLLNRLYSPNMKINNLVKLAAYVISETATQDGKVGGPIQIVTITPEGCKELSTEEVNKIIEKNTEYARYLKNLFLKEGE